MNLQYDKEILSRLCIENQIKYLGLFGSFAREDEVAFKFWHLEFRIVAVRQHHIFEFAQVIFCHLNA